MHKQTRIAVIYLSFLLTCSSLLFAEESITITTYYPSPYGSYNALQTNRLAVGDTSGDDLLTSADQPPANGQMYTARSVIFKPQSSPPALDVREGEVVYDDSTGSLRYYDGSSWQAMGGGVVSFTYYCFSNSDWGTPVCTNHGGEQGFCPSAGDAGSGGFSGLKQKASLGSWGGCGECGGHGDCPGGNRTYFLPPGGSCGPGFGSGSAVVGSAYVCSQ